MVVHSPMHLNFWKELPSISWFNRNVDNILSKKFKPPFPHILDEYIYIYSHNASTFGQSCFHKLHNIIMNTIMIDNIIIMILLKN